MFEDPSTDSDSSEGEPVTAASTMRGVLTRKYGKQNLQIVEKRAREAGPDLYRPETIDKLILSIIAEGYKKKEKGLS